MKCIFVAVAAVLLFACAVECSSDELDSSLPVNRLSLASRINRQNAGWQATLHPRFSKHTLKDLMSLLGTKMDKEPSVSEAVVNEDAKANIIINSDYSSDDIPSAFDARDHWSNCKSIGTIRDQGGCGSCWAVSAAETMTDRICIHSNGTQTPVISQDDILTCDTNGSYGCEGGYPIGAWRYYERIGVVTGGAYNSSSGCKPYQFKPCEHHVSGSRGNCTSHDYTPLCVSSCIEGYHISYFDDKHKGKKGSARTFSKNVKEIQSEIMKNGPVQAAFTVYEDFPLYHKGVYIKTAPKVLGGHAVKIVGWGNENNMDYWLVANSWNTDWGDNGFFKIKRGTNECGIEGNIVAGLPDFA